MTGDHGLVHIQRKIDIDVNAIFNMFATVKCRKIGFILSLRSCFGQNRNKVTIFTFQFPSYYMNGHLEIFNFKCISLKDD